MSAFPSAISAPGPRPVRRRIDGSARFFSGIWTLAVMIVNEFPGVTAMNAAPASSFPTASGAVISSEADSDLGGDAERFAV